MWQPSASIEALRQRAQILAKIRNFFAERGVMEVDTPALSAATVTDYHLHSFETQFVGPGQAQGQTLYMQTSPEYAMKRLLAAGSGAIYQLCKAFRNEESGRMHNPEFTMLEWYRPGFDHFDLMDEMEALLKLVLDVPECERMSYQQAFEKVLGVCPLKASLEELQALAVQHGFGDIASDEGDKDTLLQLLFSMQVEPVIGQQVPCFIYHFPASQAALARINAQDASVADRFEVYFRGVELANGFHELSDPAEQRRRFEHDNQKRMLSGLAVKCIDERLLNALHAGIPDCAGVALGVDRLILLALGKEAISDVIAFDVSRA